MNRKLTYSARSRAIILDWPTGSGKTLGVLRHILSGAMGSKRRVLARIRETVVVLPTRGMRRAWIRDLGLIYIRLGYLRARERAWRDLSLRAQESLLEELPLPCFMSYREFFKSRVVPGGLDRCSYLVMDEWHRIGVRKRRELAACVEQSRPPKRWWSLLHPAYSRARRAVFFCSATPLNPVRADRSEDEDSNTDAEESFKQGLETELKAASALISLFSGRPIQQGLSSWKDLGRHRGVRLLPVQAKAASVWKRPRCSATAYAAELRQAVGQPWVRRCLRELRSQEVEAIARLLHERTGYTYEYYYSSGVVRTRYDKASRKHVASKVSRSSFGERYANPYRIEGERSSKVAVRWLIENHGRIFRLLILLQAMGCITLVAPTSLRSRYAIRLNPARKALIFAIHQSTAKGLCEALRYLCIDDNAADLIRTSVSGGGQKGAGKRRELIRQFDKANTPRILVATDALSESYDLHSSCDTIIHYELPWAPHRLFQRVGRISRILSDGRSCRRAIVGHVVVPGSAEEERVNRLIRRTELLGEHSLLPGVRKSHWRNAREAVVRYLGIGPSLHLEEYLGGVAQADHQADHQADQRSHLRKAG